jgi:hypothetical protein
MTVLKECLAHEELGNEDSGARERLAELVEFMDVLNTWADEMLRLDPQTMVKMLGIGAKVSNVVRGRKRLRAEE